MNIKATRYLGAAALAICLLSQPTTVAAQILSADAIVDKVNGLQSTKSRGEILSISGEQKVDDQFINVNTLRFDNDARLQLRAADRDAIYIVAEEIRLSGPDFKASIEFYDREPVNGANGAPPRPPLARRSRASADGDPGANGSPGNPGKVGKSRSLPTVYIITSNIRQSQGGEPNFSDLRILVDGIDGGIGGRGGNGQDGQRGQDGRHGRSDSLGNCSRGPRSGGRGGNGGAFGPGGVGGNGGTAADVVFLVPSATVDAVKDVRVRNRGGLPGAGGLNGGSGRGASGGSRGSRPGRCTGGSPGSKGNNGQSAPVGSKAASGVSDGERGTVVYYAYDSFFN